MLAIKLAYRNLMGGKLRTVLNVLVLSFAYVVIIWQKGLINGWAVQAERDTQNWEIGGGQYWHENYDPYDPFTIEDSHAQIPGLAQTAINKGTLTPILISQSSIYPDGRVQSVFIKGIDTKQTVIELPTSHLDVDIDEIPAMLGTNMAKNNKLSIGDYVTVRWRDAKGTFDASEAKIVHIFKVDVPTVDSGILWIPIEKHREMVQLPGEATIFVTDKDVGSIGTMAGFTFKNTDFLLTDFRDMIKMKNVGGYILFLFLLSLALVAIFDTQVLSIFRRQKEIGTHIALGMTQGQVVKLFTIEGAMHAVLAAILGAIYGIPFLAWQAKSGYAMPLDSTEEFGMAIAEVIYPVYGIGLILATVLIIFIVTTIVSYLPARRISKLKPTDAIRGKIQ
ncbi:MAG: FtsX-like permease family protein [Candidatus Marinimicrobia bacterium]|nr:FtsX-like permease family protein [Candidatus Neomarinimicrobiota bacterium]